MKLPDINAANHVLILIVHICQFLFLFKNNVVTINIFGNCNNWKHCLANYNILLGKKKPTGLK